jgi:hypothetical protein
MADTNNNNDFMTYALLGVAAYLVYEYFTSTSSATVTATTAASAATSSSTTCQAGWSVDASGVCTQYTDQQLLAQINSIPWTGTNAIPAEQLQRIDPAILSTYTQYVGIVPGSVLAYMLGLGGSASNGTTLQGSDGYTYTAQNGVFVRTVATGVNGMGAVATAYRRGVAMYGW